MRNPTGICLLVALLLASTPALAPGELPAQEVEREMVPLELAQAVMWSRAEFVVGTLPEGMRDIFPIPASAEILGGVVHPGSATGVVRVPAEPRGLRARWVEHLRERGWRPISFGPSRGGFRADPPGGDGFCHGDSTHVSLAVEARGEGSLVRIVRQSHSRRSPGMSPCGDEMRDRRGMGAPAPVPDLLSPDEARTTSAGGGGGSDEWRGYARLTSDLTIPALLDHYRDQLVGQGWTAVERTDGRTMAALAVTTVDPEGIEWHGILTASRSEPEGQAVVWLDLARVIDAL